MNDEILSLLRENNAMLKEILSILRKVQDPRLSYGGEYD